MTAGCCLPTNWLGGVTWAFCCCLNHRKSACAGTDPTTKNVKKRPKRQALRPRNKCFIWWYWLSIKDLPLCTQACIAYKCVSIPTPCRLWQANGPATAGAFACKFVVDSQRKYMCADQKHAGRFLILHLCKNDDSKSVFWLNSRGMARRRRSILLP